VPGSLFPHLFKDYDYVIRQFRVVQEEPGAVRLEVVKAARFDEAVFAALVDTLRVYLGRSTRIEVRFVDTLPMVRTGKRQVALNTVKLDFQDLPGPLLGPPS
jgi:hypothetical protein